MSNPTTLQTATVDRKARLAQLKALQHKNAQQGDAAENDTAGSLKRKSPSRSPSPGVTNKYLSGRNYDAKFRGPKLGYESRPGEGQVTLETQAQTLADQSKAQQREEASQADQAVDLFKLQPKKPTWDLKRLLDKKMEVLNARTDNAIAKLVRERIQRAQKEAKASLDASSDAQEDGEDKAIGIEGAALVEATREMEREERQQEEDDAAEDEIDAVGEEEGD